MTFNPRIPLPPQIPNASQEDILNNFMDLNSDYGVNHVPFGNLIFSATRASPCVITSFDHGLTTGDSITPTHMKGLLSVIEPPSSEIVPWPINGTPFTVTVLSKDRFSLNGSNSTSYQPYIENSGDFSSANLSYGYHKPINFVSGQSAPNLSGARSSVYPSTIDDVVQLFFQNGTTDTSTAQLTGNHLTQTNEGSGFKTPWGLIFNWGQLKMPASGLIPPFPTVTLAVPCPNHIYTIQVTAINTTAKNQNIKFLTVSPTIPAFGQPFTSIIVQLGVVFPNANDIFYFVIGD